MQKITLDLVPGKKMPSLHASQFDDGRAYHIDLTENRVPYVLDGTETISVIVRKCDNTLASMDIANTFANKSYLEFEVVEQMTACSGFNYGEIILEKNGDRLGSLNFYLQVEAAPDEGGITSQSEIKNLNRQITDEVDRILPDMVDEVAEPIINEKVPEKVAELVPSAVATEVGEIVPPLVNELVPQAVGNNYYNKTQTDEKFATKETSDILNASNTVDWVPAQISLFSKDVAYRVDGTTFSSNSYFSVKFIPAQGKKYRITTSINSIDAGKVMCACIFYGSNDQIISTFGVAGIGETLTLENAELIIPSGTAYAICTSKQADIPYAYIEESNFNNITKTEDDLGIVDSSLKAYPNDTIDVLITSFVKGLRHNQTNAKLKYDNAYLVSLNPYNFKKGDVLVFGLSSSYTIYLINTSGSFVATDITSNYTLPNDMTAYIEVRKSGIMPSEVSSLIVKTKSLISGLVEDVKETISSFNDIKDRTQPIDYVVGYDDPSIKNGYHVINGNETATSSALSCCDYIECKIGDVFLILYCHSISKYNADKDFLSNVGVSSLPLYSGNEKWNMWVADYNGYIRITFYNDKTTKFAVTKLSDKPYECVCLGDSIIGNRQKPYDCPTYIQNITDLKTANCGFGGTRASTHSQSIYTPLSFWSIADAIASGDWSAIDIDWNTYGDHVFRVNKDILINIDWSKVKVVFVHYGTNDWNGNGLIDNPNDKYDKTTFCGALRYGIETILTAYKNITIVLSSPLFRYWSNSQDYSTVDSDSDSVTRTGGTLPEFVDAMREVAEEYHLPFIDNYNELGMNKFNAPAFLSDGTHPSFFDGIIKIGTEMGGHVAKTFSNARFGD